MKRAFAVVTALFVATTIFAQPDHPPAQDPSDHRPVAPAIPDILQKLSKRERKLRMTQLDSRFQDFLADVEPIILSTEIDTFLQLQTDAQRDDFIASFWRRRDTEGSVSFKEAYYQRLEIAKEQFKQVSSDRAKVFLLHGPPSGVFRSQCPQVLQPIEVWRYPAIPGVGQNVRLLFYRPRGRTDYKLWNPIGGSIALSELFAQNSLMSLSADDAAQRREQESSSPYSYVGRIQLECPQGDEVIRAITDMIQARVDLLHVFEPAQLSEEHMRDMLESVVIPNPKAPRLPADFSVRYPAKDGSRTDVQMMLLVPRAQVTPSDAGGAETYSVNVTGEVLRDGQLWEKYRYRFDFPGDFTGEQLPIVIDRLLRPAHYTARMKVLDPASGAEAIVERELDVPEVYAENVVPSTSSDAQPPGQRPRPEPPHTLDTDKAAAPDPREARLRIIPPSDDIVTGMQKIDTLVTGDAIKGVEFWFDGRKVAVRRAPPYALEFDFGATPQTRRVRAVALNAKSEPITGDEIVVNEGAEPFRVRITSPRVAPHLVGPTRVEMDVTVPDGDELGAVELYWNEQRIATMYDAPFVQTVDIPSTSGVGYLRAVAKLKDPERAPVEDVVMINTPAYMEEMNVHLVELPVTVVSGGKLVPGLAESAFRVLDEGKPISIAKFEYVKNLPLSIGMAVDSSGSMEPRMDEAQKAGAQFFQHVMRKGDKAFLVAFDKEARVVQRWSSRLQDIHAGLSRLRAEEETALYDAVMRSLYNFVGVKGQKALVVITDGKDNASKFSFDQAVEYARRTGVPIYGIGIGIDNREMDVRFKLGRLASETGGTVYYIEEARDLARVYDEIQTELRSQYVIGFYPSPDAKPGKWHNLDVKVTEGKVRTVRGYYP